MSNPYNPLEALSGAMSNMLPSVQVINAISERQKIVSNNIANASTPGYRAQQVSFADLMNHMNSPFETSLSKKMGPSPVTEEAISTGGAVKLQNELIEMQKNNLFFGMATRRLTTIFTGLKTASQVGR